MITDYVDLVKSLGFELFNDDCYGRHLMSDGEYELQYEFVGDDEAFYMYGCLLNGVPSQFELRYFLENYSKCPILSKEYEGN